MSGVKMYYGAASGQQRSALRRLEPEGVMISHATQNNTPWDGEYDLFTDPGGYHHMMSGGGEYDTPEAEYLAYVREHNPEKWAMRDYPCEPDLLADIGRSVKDQQDLTIRDHVSLWSTVEGAGLADTAVTVLQGWTVDDYLAHLERAKDRDLPLRHVAIGSICRRNQDREIAEIILSIRDALPEHSTLHAFGVKRNALRFKEVCEALDSADSCAYDWEHSRYGDGFTWRDSARGYLNWRHDLKQTMGTESLTDPVQSTFGEIQQ